MAHMTQSVRLVVFIVLGLLLAPAAVDASIMGINFPPFSYNQKDAGSAPSISPGSIQIVSGSGDIRSIFDDTPQNITPGFAASFTFQGTGGGSSGNGVCFVIQNDSRGASAISSAIPGSLSPFGVGFSGIANSVGVSIDVSNALSTNPSTGLFTNGSSNSSTEISTSPVSLDSGHPINVTLSYNGSSLNETLVDANTSASFSTSFLISNIPATVGGSTAYVGFTAGSNFSNEQFTLSNFQFTNSLPEPASLSLLGLGAAAVLMRRRHMQK